MRYSRARNPLGGLHGHRPSPDTHEPTAQLTRTPVALTTNTAHVHQIEGINELFLYASYKPCCPQPHKKLKLSVPEHNWSLWALTYVQSLGPHHRYTILNVAVPRQCRGSAMAVPRQWQDLAGLGRTRQDAAGPTLHRTPIIRDVKTVQSNRSTVSRSVSAGH